jgi:tRNA pseudouridine38-40 synthase
MVRAITGTLLNVGKNRISVDDFCKIIEAKDRRKAGSSAPANALFLEEVKYPYNLNL